MIIRKLIAGKLCNFRLVYLNFIEIESSYFFLILQYIYIFDY